MEIKEALDHLDSLDDAHWTQEGLPAVEAVKAVLGREVTRAEITDADPGFRRHADPFEGMSPAEKAEAELQTAFDDLAAVILEKQRQFSQLKEQLDGMFAQSTLLELRLTRLRRAQTKKAVSPIRAYLDQVAATRQERANRALAFLDAGTSVTDVLKLINVRAPIDRALNQRKPAPGSTRPAPHIPVKR